MPRVLVTGASGFVGGYVVAELFRRAYHPVCLVRDAEKLGARLAEWADGVTMVQGSLFDDGALAEAVEKSNAVIHLVGIIREVLRR